MRLKAFEMAFLSDEGLPGRPWYKHLGIAPGRWLGYGAVPLPGITEAITLDKNVDLAKHQLSILRKAMLRAAEAIRG